MLQPLKLLPLLVALAQGSGPICPFHVAEECCVTVGRSRRGISQRVLTVGVIGAGFAGLGAATRLSALGCRVQVIEARPRVGGRTLIDGDFFFKSPFSSKSSLRSNFIRKLDINKKNTSLRSVSPSIRVVSLLVKMFRFATHFSSSGGGRCEMF